jgi:phosphoribosylamine--glycine ligase
LVQKLLVPLIGDLAGQFVGPLDVNVILEKSSNEPVFLEYSPRFGYDAIFALMELLPEVGEFLYKLAQGQAWSDKIDLEKFAGDVRLSIPPFPAKGAKDVSEECVGVPIFGVDSSNRHQHLVEVMLDVNNEYVTSGPHGYVMSVTGLGDTPRSAQGEAYRNVDKIHIPNMRYRNDLVEAIGDVYHTIETTGWLEHQSKSLQPTTLMRSMARKR